MGEKKTRLLPVDPAQPETAVLAIAARIIRQGGLVAFPTETVYGLGADALSETAVGAIFTAKQRPAYDPIIVHIADPAALGDVAGSVPPMAQALAAALWPGPLTLVLPRGAAVPDGVTAGGNTVAVRCPAHPVARELIRAAGTPIGAPSANRFSHTSPTTALHVWADLAGRIDLILDGGPTAVGIESTVLDVTGEVPTVLRPGGVPLETLRALLPEVIVRRQMAPETPALRAAEVLPGPGMLARHYAPRTEMWLVTGGETAVRQQMAALAGEAAALGRRVALLLADEDRPYFNGTPLSLVTVGPAARLDVVASRLYDAIRQLDGVGADLILARDFSADGLGLAVADRLRRAAQRVIEAG